MSTDIITPFSVTAFFVVASALTSCTMPDHSGSGIKQMILSGKPYSCHEETVEEFKNRIEGATVFCDSPTGMEYLYINGDGAVTERLFIYDRNSNVLKMISNAAITEDDGEKVSRDVDVLDEESKQFLSVP